MLCWSPYCSWQTSYSICSESTCIHLHPETWRYPKYVKVVVLVSLDCPTFTADGLNFGCPQSSLLFSVSYFVLVQLVGWRCWALLSFRVYDNETGIKEQGQLQTQDNLELRGVSWFVCCCASRYPVNDNVKEDGRYCTPLFVSGFQTNQTK